MLARRVYVLDNAPQVFEGTREALNAAPEITSRHIGIGERVKGERALKTNRK